MCLYFEVVEKSYNRKCVCQHGMKRKAVRVVCAASTQLWQNLGESSTRAAKQFHTAKECANACKCRGKHTMLKLEVDVWMVQLACVCTTGGAYFLAD